MDKAKGKNHHKVCWNFGKTTMIPDHRGSVCTSCGATYNDIPRPGKPALIYSEPDAYGNVTSRPWGVPEL